MSTKVYLGVGSNLNRENSLRFAFAKISPLLKNCKKPSEWKQKAKSGAKEKTSLQKVCQSVRGFAEGRKSMKNFDREKLSK